ncbi:MAG TPA: M23 family metallopeptidase [Thermoanaerobaculia bacterium]|jgi:murein DD-endopeptidase MepM/ murein hydrolase activator NlpD
MSRYSTIIFVPHARARFRKLTVSTRLLAAAAAGIFVLLVSAVVFAWAYVSTAQQDRRYHDTAAENARLKSSERRLEERLAGLAKQISQFEDRTRRLAIVAGLPREKAGLGGPLETSSNLDPTSPERQQAIAARLDALESQFAKREAVTSSTPTVAPVRGLLNSGFGERADPFTGSPAFHTGLDISTRLREPVLATAAGTVSRAGWSPDYGNVVEIDHPAGFRTVYGHLDVILTRDGQTVQRGDRIGLVGSTGRSTGPHLHYEVRRADHAVNPLEYILDAR